jgi:hypothetical protein
MKYIKFVCLATLLSVQALAWGPTGHRVVGEIAQRHLTPTASERVKVLLDGQSLAEVATWADEVRNVPGYENFAPLHYVNILPEFETYEEKAAAEPEPHLKGDVVRATLELIEYLRTEDPKVFIPTPALMTVDKKTALKLLIHFVGDIHQPLHVIDALDSQGQSIGGGNSIQVNWMDKWKTNLHSVWDDEIIDHEKLSFEDLATFSNHVTFEQQKLWSSLNVLKWADESLQYRGQVFNFPDKQVEGSPLFISYKYISINRETIKLRLDQAGTRLASVLNYLYSK